jgi:TRAP-type C4-dicarboxylate transport system permease small subunit
METRSKTGRWLRARAENILAALLLSMFVVFLLQVLFRYVLNISVDWTVEWVTLAWLWGILFGYAFVVKGSEVIRLDMVYYAVPRPWRRAFDIFGGLVIATIFIFTLPAVWITSTSWHASARRPCASPSTGSFPSTCCSRGP